MPLTRGESVAIGVAVEGTPGTFATPTDWVRARSPFTTQPQIERADIQETKQTGVDNQDQVLTKSHIAGEGAVNLRFRTIGYFLKSLLGGVSSATEAGESAVYRHTFTLDPAVAQPALSLALARGGTLTDKEIVGAIVSSLELNFPLDDVVNGTVNAMARSEANAGTSFTPAFASDDHLAPHQMVTIKEAADVSGLSGATPFDITEASASLDRQSSERMAVSSVNPQGFKAGLLNLTGSFNIEKEDDTFYDYHVNNTARAVQIDVINTAQTIGSGSNPTLSITLPKVFFTVSESRPIDEVLVDEVEWRGSYDDDEAAALTISLVNEIENYDAA